MDSLPAKIMNEVKLLLRDGSNVSSSFSFFFYSLEESLLHVYSINPYGQMIGEMIN